MFDFARITGARRSTSATSTTKTRSRTNTWGSVRSIATEDSGSCSYEPTLPPSHYGDQGFSFVSHDEVGDQRESQGISLPSLPYSLDPSYYCKLASSGSILLQHSGSIDVSRLKGLVDTSLKQTSLSSVQSFVMSHDSSLGYHTVVEAMEYLSVEMSDVNAIVLVLDFYILEELQRLAPILSRFRQLQQLVILDAEADPLTDTSILKPIVNVWNQSCPTLRTIKFREDTRWIREKFFVEQRETHEWVEYYGTDDIIESLRRPRKIDGVTEISLPLNSRKRGENHFTIDFIWRALGRS